MEGDGLAIRGANEAGQATGLRTRIWREKGRGPSLVSGVELNWTGSVSEPDGEHDKAGRRRTPAVIYRSKAGCRARGEEREEAGRPGLTTGFVDAETERQEARGRRGDEVDEQQQTVDDGGKLAGAACPWFIPVPVEEATMTRGCPVSNPAGIRARGRPRRRCQAIQVPAMEVLLSSFRSSKNFEEEEPEEEKGKKMGSGGGRRGRGKRES